MKFKHFELDDFQIAAIEAVNRGNSVIVAAPTGVGKTLIAEYIIETYLQEGKRIIYTAPIKALSNQKYRDFSSQWPDKVGIITGDVVINSDAQILIMTTEIFRNMLITEKELLQDVKYVIFDEVHYINDIQRGVIWEESIIFAHEHMRFLLLSATIPNVNEFAEWIETIKKHKVEIVKEFNRVVPLSHYIYTPAAGVLAADDFFRRYKKIFQKKKIKVSKKKNILHDRLIKYLEDKALAPVIYFCFSRTGCEDLAMSTARKYDFSTPSEKEEIAKQYMNILEKYGVEEYGSIATIFEYLLRGIGVHHAGLLPVMKELVECLYSQGLLKILYVTETFAVGVNMPARTSVFDSIRKYDGISFRNLLGREYFQMAGRAGRRGIDREGTAITIVDDVFDNIEEFRAILTGDLEKLESQFKLSYNTVVNLYHQYDDEHIKKILSMSYLEFQQQKKLAKIREQEERLKLEIEKMTKSIPCGDVAHIAEFKEKLREIAKHASKVEIINRELRQTPPKSKDFYRLNGKKRSYVRTLQKSKKMLSQIKCADCEHNKYCKRILYELGHNSRLLEHNAESGKYMNQYDIFRQKLSFLQSIGYLSKDSLLYKGDVASKIYGYELIISELMHEGIIEEFSNIEIAVLVICIVFEKNPKSMYPFTGIVPPDLKAKINKCRSVIFRLRKMEEEAGMEPSKPIFIDAMEFAWRWVTGQDFSEIMDVCGDDEGDIIRTFRCAIDLLRQIRRCLIENPVAKEKVASAIDLINRDIVNASEIIG